MFVDKKLIYLVKPTLLRFIMKNKYKFRKNINIGGIEAEDDRFLIESFVEKPEYEIIKDPNDKRFILLGNTGTGKTAILKYLEEEETDKHVRSRINPEEMSLRFLSNSNILDYLTTLGVKLNLFYKVLWKHVLLIEVLKFICKKDDDEWLAKLLDAIIKSHNKDRKKLENYLQKYKNDFWKTTEHRIKEIEQSIQENLAVELDMKVGDLKRILAETKANKKYSESNSEKIKTEIIYKCQKVVNDIQIKELNDIIKILQSGAFTRKKQQYYYIIVDDLDKEWVDSPLVYELIKSLIDSIKDLRFEKVKIIVALRENLYQKVLDYSKHKRGVQQEKYDACTIRITWDEKELIELVEKRLANLMKSAYTNATPKVQDVFQKTSKGKGFQYILDRSLMRPRYIIDFFNKCIIHSDGNTIIPSTAIDRAENEYSRQRLISIYDEWRENYPFLQDAVTILKGRKNVFSFADLKVIVNENDDLLNTLSKITSYKDSINNRRCLDAFDKFIQNMDTSRFLLFVIQVFYDTGIIGIKIDSESKISYSYVFPISTDEEVKESSKIYISKTFYKALNINASYTIKPSQ